MKDYELQYHSRGPAHNPEFTTLTFRLGFIPEFQMFTSNPNCYVALSVKDAKKLHTWLTRAIPKMKKQKKLAKKYIKDLMKDEV